MRKFVLAAFCTVAMVGIVLADEFQAVVTKVDGSKVTFFKTKGGGKGVAAEKDGGAVTKDAVKGVKVVKGGKMPMDVDGGLTADQFKKIDDAGIPCTITIADDGKDKGMITQIAIKGGGKGKKKGG
jgi:hypothetical protein